MKRATVDAERIAAAIRAALEASHRAGHVDLWRAASSRSIGSAHAAWIAGYAQALLDAARGAQPQDEPRA